MNEISNRIKEAIEHSGVDILEIAKRCGVSRQEVYKWIRGETKKISGENLVALSIITGYESLWLMTGDGEKTKLLLSKDDMHAVQINRALGVKERKAWYRVGDSFIEHHDDEEADETKKKQNTQ